MGKTSKMLLLAFLILSLGPPSFGEEIEAKEATLYSEFHKNVDQYRQIFRDSKTFAARWDVIGRLMGYLDGFESKYAETMGLKLATELSLMKDSYLSVLPGRPYFRNKDCQGYIADLNTHIDPKKDHINTDREPKLAAVVREFILGLCGIPGGGN